MHLRYCLCISLFDYDENRHPEQVMRDLGISYQYATPQSVADQWWFWNCENIPDELPEYLTKADLDPMDNIGYGLSAGRAKEIRDYRKSGR